jgi:hypothetical protein
MCSQQDWNLAVLLEEKKIEKIEKPSKHVHLIFFFYFFLGGWAKKKKRVGLTERSWFQANSRYLACNLW